MPKTSTHLSVPPISDHIDAGLGDKRQAEVHIRLQEEAAGLAGYMMLGHLCEMARDLLTAMNAPEGDCIFCRCPLLQEDEPPGPSGREQQLFKLPCYHVYHLCAAIPPSPHATEDLFSMRKSLAATQLHVLHAQNSPVLSLTSCCACAATALRGGGAGSSVA